MRSLRFATLSLMFLLSGCCLDCTNTKAEFEGLQAQLATLNQIKADAQWIETQADFYSQKAVQERANESAVMIARVCDYVVPVCERELVEPGRQLIAKYGTQYDSPVTVKNQFLKLIFMVSSTLASLFVLVALWRVVAWVSKQENKTANQLVSDLNNEGIAIEEQAHQRVIESDEELQSSSVTEEERLRILKAEANDAEIRAEETKSKLIAMEMRRLVLQDDIIRLQKIRDGLNGSF
jgi:hypothetical protein